MCVNFCTVSKLNTVCEFKQYVSFIPEYNCSLPPALTDLLDYFPPASFRQIGIDRIFTKNIKRTQLSYSGISQSSSRLTQWDHLDGFKQPKWPGQKLSISPAVIAIVDSYSKRMWIGQDLIFRPYLSELGLVTLPSTLLIPTIQVLKVSLKV